jgi:hypothetical protein
MSTDRCCSSSLKILVLLSAALTLASLLSIGEDASELRWMQGLIPESHHNSETLLIGHRASPDEPLKNDTQLFGFYYQVYKSPKATLQVIKSLYQHMPEAPIYMVSSAGYHYEPLAERFPRINFVFDDTVHDPRHARFNLSIWFDRVQAASEWCNCSYLVFLEDDLKIRKPVLHRPPYDAGGQKSQNKKSFPDATYDYFESRSTWSYNHSAMSAGSYIKTSAFLDAYKHISWPRIEAMLQFKPRTIGAYTDMTLGVVMMDRGYVLQPWDQVAQFDDYSLEDPAFVHGNKSYYEVPIQPEDGPVITEEEDLCNVFKLKCKIEKRKAKANKRTTTDK